MPMLLIRPGRLLAVWLLALLLCVLPRTGGAVVMRHHDLASLAMLSDAIVLARRIRTETKDHREIVHHEVIKVYRGQVAVGDRIPVDYDAYVLSTNPRNPAEAPPAALSDQVVLFLVRDESRSAGSLQTSGWSLAASGLRVILGDRVHRFEQAGNPGSYAPVGQRRDPHDVMHDPRAGDVLDLPGFERELAAAVARADEVRVALRDPRSPAGKQRLLDLIGPPPGTEDDRPVVLTGLDFWKDEGATAILEALAEAGDLAGTLAGVARVRGGVDLFMTQRPFKAVDLLAFADQRDQPVPLRVGALALLEELGALKDPAIEAGLLRLLADPEAPVRTAAAKIQGESRAWRAALVERFTREQDVHARYALARAADRLGIFQRLTAPADAWPLLVVERKGRRLQLQWLPSDWGIDELVLHIERADGPPRREVLVPGDGSQSETSWAQGNARGLDFPLTFDPPPSDPRIELVAEIRMVRDKPSMTRDWRLSLPRLPAAPAMTPAAPVPAEPATPPLPPTPAGPQSGITREAPGCACTQSPSITAPWLLVLACGRRRRSHTT